MLASYADGKPAVATLKVRAAGNAEQTVTTDAGGVAVDPPAGRRAAAIARGRGAAMRGQSRLELPCRSKCARGDEQILLRTERAVYRAGERIQLQGLLDEDAGHRVRGCGARTGRRC